MTDLEEHKRLVLLLVRQDFPDMDEQSLANISKPQRTGYQSRVTTFLKLAALFGYVLAEEVRRRNESRGFNPS